MVSHALPDNVRQFRMNAAKRAGTIDFVLARAKFRCQYCGQTSEEAQGNGRRLAVDHVVPVSRGGDESADNLVACCGPCNSIKKNRPLSEARHFLLLRAIGWPKFTESQLDWMRARGVDLSEYDAARLHFEK